MNEKSEMKTKNNGSIIFIVVLSIVLILSSNIALYVVYDLPNPTLMSLLRTLDFILLSVLIIAILINIKSHLLSIIFLIISWASVLSYSINESAHLTILNNQNAWLTFKAENNCKLISKGTVNFLIFPLANNGWLCADEVIYYNRYAE